MRTLRWLPLAYLAGFHGFAIFAPYAAVLVAVCHLTTWRRKRVAVRVKA